MNKNMILKFNNKKTYWRYAFLCGSSKFGRPNKKYSLYLLNINLNFFKNDLVFLNFKK